jgi:uncharacterized protein YcaQ
MAGSAPAISTTADAIRRLAIERQLLSGPRPPPTADGMVHCAQRLGRIQLDPTAVVARSHLLVLWSRLGIYDRELLNGVLWRDRRLFEHGAFLRPIAHVPLVRAMARHWPAMHGPTRAAVVTGWMDDNDALRRHILDRLRADGPLPSDAFDDLAVRAWRTGGYFDGRNVGRMLELLEGAGLVAVAGRHGATRVWDLPERIWPAELLRIKIDDATLLRRRVEISLRAQGVLSATDLRARAALPGAPLPVADLVAEGAMLPVAVGGSDGPWPGTWYVHPDDAPGLEGGAAPDARTSLLSPFDNLIHDRVRTERLFGFAYRMEIYVPEAKRRHGYFAMPILHDGRLIGTVDPARNADDGVLEIRSVRLASTQAPPDAAEAVAAAVTELARFVGMDRVRWGRAVPRGWRTALSAR